MGFEPGTHWQMSRHPTLSPDNQYLAYITPGHDLNLVNLNTGYVFEDIQLPKGIKAVLPQVQILRWALLQSATVEQVGSRSTASQTRLLFATENRLIVLKTSPLHQDGLSAQLLTVTAQLIADHQFEDHLGKIVTAEFILGPEQALVTFEMNTHISLMSFSKPQRDDIPLPKFRDNQGFAQAQNHKYFAVLLRSKGQDQVAVLALRGDVVESVSTFPSGTTDAQGLMWSPQNDPVLAVWDSGAYGLSIRFFTALGHPLKELDLHPQALSSNHQLLPTAEIGISCLKWVSQKNDESMLVVGSGGHQGPRLAVRRQNLKSMSVAAAEIYDIKPTIAGTESIIWYETDNNKFDKQKSTVHLPIKISSELSMVEVSLDCSMIATICNTDSKTVWIWSQRQLEPAAHVLFHQEIKQLVWHPKLPNVLAIITGEKRPCIYVWHHLFHPPQRIRVSFEETISTSKWIAQWICVPDMTKCPLLFSSKKHFGIGIIDRSDDEVLLKPLLRGLGGVDDREDDGEIFETPSKQGKAPNSVISWNLGDPTDIWNDV